MKQLRNKCILVNEGKPNKLVLEPSNFADVVMVEREPYSKIGLTHCL